MAKFELAEHFHSASEDAHDVIWLRWWEDFAENPHFNEFEGFNCERLGFATIEFCNGIEHIDGFGIAILADEVLGGFVKLENEKAESSYQHVLFKTKIK